jgi:hypothetical protein
LADDFGKLNLTLQQILASIREMNKELNQTLVLNKDLTKEQEKGEKQTETFIRKYSQLATAQGPFPTFAKGWTALRRFSSRLAPEFWAIQNATVGFLDSIQTGIKIYDKFGDKRDEVDGKAVETAKSKLEILMEEKKQLEELKKAADDAHKKRVKDNQQIVNFLREKQEYVQKHQGLTMEGKDGKQVGLLSYEENVLLERALAENTEESRFGSDRLKEKASQEKAIHDKDEEIKQLKEKQKQEDDEFEFLKKIRKGRENIAKFMNKMKPDKLIKIVKDVGKAAKTFIAFAVKIVAGITLLYILFKRFNIKEFILSYVAGVRAIWEQVRDPLFTFIDSAGTLFGLLFEAGQIVMAALTGDLTEDMKNRIKPLLIELKVVLGMFLKAAFDLLLAIGRGLYDGFIAWFGGWLQSFKEDGHSIVSAVIDMAIGIGAIALAVMFIASGSWIYAVGVVLGAVLLSTINKYLFGSEGTASEIGTGMIGFGAMPMAKGGTTPYSGMFIVGEKGPELVSLPAGSRVYNNQETQSMGNTINVTVQGRVGASDAELRDIAQKIGRMVNMEVNRTTASRTRGA